MLGFQSRMKRLFYFYQKKSIQYMISISFTLVAVIGMVLLGSSLSLQFVSSTENRVAENNKRLVDQVNLNLDLYLRNMMRVSDAMYYRVIKNTDFTTQTVDKEMNLLYATNRDSLVSIGVFSDKGKVVAAAPLSQLKSSVDPRDSRWFIDATNKIENLHFSTPHVQNLFVDPDTYRWVVSLSRSVELTYDGDITQGVLLVDMNFSGIEQICKGANLGESGYIYLVDKSGEIIYHPRQQLIYSNLIKENNVVAASYEDGNHFEKFEGQDRLVTVKTAGYTGWKMVGVSQMSDITSDYYQIQIFALFIMVFCIFILVFVNMFVSSRIANPIKALEKSVKKLENGEMNVDISISGSYEIRHLGKTIQSMVKQMHTLMDNILEEQESKRKSELDALQSQINPHFLYNTLDSIVWMVENERYDGAVVMVTALARLFRISLSKGKNIITVKDELEHARNYLTIQHTRYKNKFTYRIEAQDEVLELATMKLIVQPMIENAIYHGMEYMSGDGEILIKAYLKQDDLYIDITDNGPGMLQETADSLLTEQVAASPKTGSGIGLKNVQKRIQLCFGMEYGLNIFSEPDEGTTVRIHLPRLPYSEYNEKEG